MYQGPGGQLSRDEYLLGRAIDKQITQQYEEPESGPSAETGLLPGSIFNSTTSISSLDMASKIREDPLFEIRWGDPIIRCLLFIDPFTQTRSLVSAEINLELGCPSSAAPP